MAIVAFDFLTGRRIFRIEAATWSATAQVSKATTMQVEAPATPANIAARLYENTHAWRTVLADVDWTTDTQGHRVGIVHSAGVVTRRELTDSASWECTDIGGYLARLPVLPVGKAGSDFVGRVPVDASNGDGEPTSSLPEDWRVRISGSLPDLITQLVQLGLEWQQLPVTLPALTGGYNYRQYAGPDLARISDRIDDIAGLENGPEWLWEPLVSDGSLLWRLHAADEVVANRWRIDGTVERATISEVDYEQDGADMATDAWTAGGTQDDKILLASAHDTAFTRSGGPRLVALDTSHDTVSEVDTLRDYARAAVRDGAKPSEAFTLKVRRDLYPVRAGDWLDLRWGRWYMEPRWWRLKVLQVDSDQTEWLKLACRERKA